MTSAAGANEPPGIELAEGIWLPLEFATSTMAVLANRGGGKSAVTHLLVEKMYSAGVLAVVIDVKGDWWGIRSSADGKGPGLPFVIFGGENGDIPLEPSAGTLLADLIVDDRIPAVLDLSHMSKTNARRFATDFSERLYSRNREPLHVVIEEADVLVPQRATSDTARLLGAMEDLAKRGRHRGLGMTIVSQRSQETAKSVLELMETVVLLRMTGPRSIKAVQDWIGVNADQDENTVRTIISGLPSLPVGEGWIWSPGFLRVCERVSFPMFETFDSHATPTVGDIRVVPKARADIDMERLGAEIAATAERARENDPRALKTELSNVRRELADALSRGEQAMQQVRDHERLIAERDREIGELRSLIKQLQSTPRTAEAVKFLRSASELVGSALTALAEDPVEVSVPALNGAAAPLSDGAPLPDSAETAETVAVAGFSSQRSTAPATPAERPLPVKFRAGAQRMITSLARMAPLRLTPAQWGMVAKLRHTGGTWSTYLGELKRAGLLDESPAGFTLSEAGWDFVGARPDPMTAVELQQHYLGILRKGAARMLQAVIDAYPKGLSRARLAAASEIAESGGTFSTYLGELRRNGLIEQKDELIVATAVLMHGAAAQQL
ncbi:ATP-binding protein [Mycobacteroides abscessus]|uniref:ATP-binding protein n=1 Tax=Mycobacteroides abscessus TaxID=36809 RepID=UPI0009CD3BBB|nr:ATP-binding protein [Mycobacteroides abscessus]SLH40934.1 AAA-like domain [Mycobacteroides abscessus subsp. massiliense]